MAIAYIGLGSNLGDRADNLDKAIRRLASRSPVTILERSSILETEPVDYLDQPRFLNQIIKIETGLYPRDLLQALKHAEADLGRKKSLPKGPRSIDLDILLYDDLVLDTPDLVIPHPEIKNRKFILQHLVELDQELVDPVTGIKFRDLISR
jgi:2-amino-4-hydroxy-6-hydroxymethyldihydropteridine diphosphokinase